MSESFATPWTGAHQAPLFMGFFRQEYWNRLPFPPPGDLPNPEMEPVSPALAGRFFTAESSRKRITNHAATQTRLPGDTVNSPLHPHTVNHRYLMFIDIVYCCLLLLMFIPHLPSHLIFSSLLFLMILNIVQFLSCLDSPDSSLSRLVFPPLLTVQRRAERIQLWWTLSLKAGTGLHWLFLPRTQHHAESSTSLGSTGFEA